MMPLIWVALALFLLSIWLRDDVARRRSAAAGWGAFAGYWAWQVGVYARLLDVTPTSEVDPSNTVLSAFVVGLCLLFARHILTKPGDILLRVTRVTALVGILYFPFAEFPLLHGAIIGGTAHITVSVLLLLGTPARVASPEIIVGVANPFVIGPTKVEIILACTAIESIALFAGVIFGMKAPRRRQMLAFAIVIPGIYLLNLVRNLYVILAYAYNWYGPAEESFYIAHTVYAKIGSTLALLLMAAITFKLLPEVVDFIEETGYAVMGRQRKPRAGGGSP